MIVRKSEWVKFGYVPFLWWRFVGVYYSTAPTVLWDSWGELRLSFKKGGPTDEH